MEQIAILVEDIDNQAKPIYCVFDDNGGTIGNTSINHLCLPDESIQERHVNINYEDGCFTISCIGDSEVFYNESFSKLEQGYETIIEVGDSFRIGKYKCSFIDTKDIKDDFLDYKKVLDKIADESDFAIDVKPRVQLDTKILDEENMADNLDKHKILEKLSPAQVINTIPSDIANTHDTIQNIITSSQSMRTDSISKKEISPQTKESDIILHTKNIQTFLQGMLQSFSMPNNPLSHINMTTYEHILDTQELDSILHNTLLIDSIPLLNTLILALISKELHSPYFEILEHDIFANSLTQAIIQSHQNSKESLQCMLLKALSTYLKNPL